MDYNGSYSNIGGIKMRFIKVTTDDAGWKIMSEAASFLGMPISIWARVALLESARATNFKALCTTPKVKAPKEVKYKWCGEPCTKEYYEEHAEDERRGRAATAAAVSSLPPEIRKKL